MDEHDVFKPFSDQALPVPMQKGGLLFLDSLTFHAAGRNTSSEARPTIALGYRSVDELERHPDAEREVLVAGGYLYRGNDRQGL